MAVGWGKLEWPGGVLYMIIASGWVFIVQRFEFLEGDVHVFFLKHWLQGNVPIAIQLAEA